MNRPTGLNCFIYLRKSRTDIEEEKKALQEGFSFDVLKRHRKQLLELAKQEQYNILDIYEEVVSGEHLLDRPQIQQMLKLVEQGHCDGVLVMDLDRLGRGDMYDMGMIYRAFQYSGTLIVTPTEVIDPNSDGAELLFGVKSILSREELKGITKRLQRGRQISAREGKSISKKPPYGYLRDETLKLHPDPETSWVVKYIFERVVEGAGRILIAQELDGMGVTPPRGKGPWSPSTIAAIIKNEVYTGHIIWGKIKYIKRGGGKYTRKRVPPDQWHRHDHAHEPLVSEGLFKEANLALSGRWRPPTKEANELTNPLAGILQCERCGRAIRYFPRKDRPNDDMRCIWPGCRGKQRGCSFPFVEKAILDGIRYLLQQYEAKDEVNREKKDHVISLKEKVSENLKKELDDLNTQRNRLHDFLEQGVYDIATFRERQQVVVIRIRKAEDQLKEIEREIKKEKIRVKQQKEVVPKLWSVIEAYQKSDDPLKKNRLLKTVLEKATYYRDPTWTEPGKIRIQVYQRIW